MLVRGDNRNVDWLVVGAVSAVVVVTGVVAFEVVGLVRSDTKTASRPPLLASYGSSVDRSAYEIPGFATARAGDPPPLSFPLIRLIDPDRDSPPTTNAPPATPPAATAGKAPAQPKPSSAPPPTMATQPPTAAPQPPPNEVKLAKLTTPETDTLPQPRLEVWRVVPTANASYFNLGGHIDKNGIVDNLATPHLRDALKQHSKFGQLPPDIKTHILTQNIDLPKIAPYRNLLGMDDRILEQEQAVKFIRVR
jgi:hypothetical protein